VKFSSVNNILGVMRGLDPRIHDEMQHVKILHRPSLQKLIMDCRVKPGNDY